MPKMFHVGCSMFIVAKHVVCMWLKDLDTAIGKRHDGIHGLKKIWKCIVWKVLQRRRQNGTLADQVWNPPTSIPTEKPSASSSTPATEWLGRQPDEVCDVPEDQDCGFPRQEPVEITPMTISAEEESGDPDQEKKIFALRKCRGGQNRWKVLQCWRR